MEFLVYGLQRLLYFLIRFCYFSILNLKYLLFLSCIKRFHAIGFIWKLVEFSKERTGRKLLFESWNDFKGRVFFRTHFGLCFSLRFIMEGRLIRICFKHSNTLNLWSLRKKLSLSVINTRDLVSLFHLFPISLLLLFELSTLLGSLFCNVLICTFIMETLHLGAAFLVRTDRRWDELLCHWLILFLSELLHSLLSVCVGAYSSSRSRVPRVNEFRLKFHQTAFSIFHNNLSMHGSAPLYLFFLANILFVLVYVR